MYNRILDIYGEVSMIRCYKKVCSFFMCFIAVTLQSFHFFIYIYFCLIRVLL